MTNAKPRSSDIVPAKWRYTRDAQTQVPKTCAHGKLGALSLNFVTRRYGVTIYQKNYKCSFSSLAINFFLFAHKLETK